MDGDDDDDIIEISTRQPRRDEEVVDLALSPGDSPHISHIDSLAITPPHVRRCRTKVDKQTPTSTRDWSDGKDPGRLAPDLSSIRRNRAERLRSTSNSVQEISPTHSGYTANSHAVDLSSQQDELIAVDKWIDTRNCDGERWVMPRSYGFQSPRSAQAARQRQQEAQKLRSAARTTPSAAPIPGSYPTLSLSASQLGVSQLSSVSRVSPAIHTPLTQGSTARESLAPHTSSATALPTAAADLARASPHATPHRADAAAPVSTPPYASATSEGPSTPRKRSRPASAHSHTHHRALGCAPALPNDTHPRKHVALATAGLAHLAQAAPASAASLSSSRGATSTAAAASAPSRGGEGARVCVLQTQHTSEHPSAPAPAPAPAPAHAHALDIAIGGAGPTTAAVVGAAAGQATARHSPEDARAAPVQGLAVAALPLAPPSSHAAPTSPSSPSLPSAPALALAQALGAALAPAHPALPSMLARLFAPERAHALAPALCPLLALLATQCARSERVSQADGQADIHGNNHGAALAEVGLANALAPCSVMPAEPASAAAAEVAAAAIAGAEGAAEADIETTATAALVMLPAALSVADEAGVIELSDADDEEEVDQRTREGAATARPTPKPTSTSTSLPARIHTPVSSRRAAPPSPLRGRARPLRAVPVVPVTRGRARESLRAYSCVQCEQWYRTMHGCSPPRADCEHVRSSRVALVASSRSSSAAAHTRPPPTAQSGLQTTSRHRSAYSPPRTPPGYWDIGFGDSQ